MNKSDPKFKQYLKDQQKQFNDYRAAHKPQQITENSTQHAAPALVLMMWRNTNTVETRLHAGKNAWSDPDMLRLNTRATKLAWENLNAMAKLDKTCRLDQEAIQDSLINLRNQFRELIPSIPVDLRTGYDDETSPMCSGYARTCAEWGFEFWLHALGVIGERERWWASKSWPPIEKHIVSQQGAPDPETFAQRLHEEPWELTDEQAWFVIRNIYGTSNS